MATTLTLFWYTNISAFQESGMIKSGQNSTRKKIPGPKINPMEILCQISEPYEFPEGIKINDIT